MKSELQVNKGETAENSVTNSVQELKSEVPKDIIVVGSPRSGTTWIGSIFDSHPDTFFLMEPDTIDRGDYPHTSDRVFLAEARKHYLEMSKLRASKVVGNRPFFPKSYRSAWLANMRVAAIYGVKGLERLIGRPIAIPVPDFGKVEEARLVIKSVSMLGRSASWRAAMPYAEFVHVIRHPCGHVDSVLRGQKGHKLADGIPLGFSDCSVAKKYGITQADLRTMPEHLRVAWRWAVLNEKAMEEIDGAHLLVYDDFCADPLTETERLFQELGLSWSDQTRIYLEESTSSDGSYFETKRLPLSAAMAWKTQFAFADDVLSALAGTKALALFEG